MRIIHILIKWNRVPLYMFVLITLLTGIAASQTTPPANSAQIVFTARLTGIQESSSDTSKATATAWAILSADRTQLIYRVTYAGLTSPFTASHFHLGLPGISGPVIQPIQYKGNTAEGTWANLQDSIVADLLKGAIYINIHSKNYPAGEIRGQLKPAEGIPFTFSPDPAQVSSPVTSGASGTGWAVLTVNDSGPALSYGITIAGLTSSYTASHFHLGGTQQNGGVIQPIAFSDSSAYGTWNGISDKNLLALLHDSLYVNIHSMQYPNGEIRGQVNESGPVSFYASLDGAQETPPVTTNAKGTGWFVLNDSLSSLSYGVTYANLSDAFTASHFHAAAMGKPGGVVKPITYKGNTATDTWRNIPDSLFLSLIKGDLYVNVHSKAHPAGEIRGQVLLNKGIAFLASLNGGQSVPPVTSSGSGSAWLSFLNDTLKYQITIAGLSSPFSASHFHLGAAGVNGNVVQPITFTDSTVNSLWSPIDNSLLTALIKGDLYINVHTTNNPNGEIRGQVLPSAFNNSPAFTAVDDKISTVPLKYELGQNYPNPFNPATTISYSIPKSGFVTIKVYNMLGREIATLVNEQKPAGVYKIVFNGSGLSSGVYFYRMDAGNIISTRKLVLLK